MRKMRLLIVATVGILVAMPVAGGTNVDRVKAACGADRVESLIASWSPPPSALTGAWEVTGSAGSTKFERGAYRAMRKFEGAVLVEALIPAGGPPAVISLNGIDSSSSSYGTVWMEGSECRVLEGTFSLADDGGSGSRRMKDGAVAVELDYVRVGVQRPETAGVDCTGSGYTEGSSGPCCGGAEADEHDKCP